MATQRAMKMQTKANKELVRVLAKPKGRQHINRSAPEKRTWLGTTYDSRDEMLFHQVNSYARRCVRKFDTFNLGALGSYTPDFRVDSDFYYEIKGAKVTKPKIHKRTGKVIPEKVKPHWTGESRMRFLRAREMYTRFTFIVVVRHRGAWMEVEP